MLYSIHNNCISITVHKHGVQLQSIRDADGTEYLWQGDPSYWEDQSPNLFPYIERMIGKRYFYKGHEYPMEIHGFASRSDFEIVEQEQSRLVFQLCHSEETLRQYPWKFRFRIEYTISGRKSVSIFYPQMDYIGFWHMLKTRAPYVCIEPWSSLPSGNGERTDLENQENLLALAPGKTYCNRWSVELKQAGV